MVKMRCQEKIVSKKEEFMTSQRIIKSTLAWDPQSKRFILLSTTLSNFHKVAKGFCLEFVRLYREVIMCEPHVFHQV